MAERCGACLYPCWQERGVSRLETRCSARTRLMCSCALAKCGVWKVLRQVGSALGILVVYVSVVVRVGGCAVCDVVVLVGVKLVYF
jgi:hypothetical protein